MVTVSPAFPPMARSRFGTPRRFPRSRPNKTDFRIEKKQPDSSIARPGRGVFRANEKASLASGPNRRRALSARRQRRLHHVPRQLLEQAIQFPPCYAIATPTSRASLAEFTGAPRIDPQAD